RARRQLRRLITAKAMANTAMSAKFVIARTGSRGTPTLRMSVAAATIGTAQIPTTASARVTPAASRSSPVIVHPRSKVVAEPGWRTARHQAIASAAIAMPAPAKKSLPMFPGPYSRRNIPRVTIPAMARSAAVTIAATCLADRLFVDMEDLLNSASEIPGHGDGQGEGGGVPAGFDGVDRLARDAEILRQRGLREASALAQLTDVVLHARFRCSSLCSQCDKHA